jgi:hypothetical protein
LSYFKATEVFIENLRKLKVDTNEAKILYSVLLYIMKDAEPKYFELWWQKEREVKVCNFFALLKFCISIFRVCETIFSLNLLHSHS